MDMGITKIESWKKCVVSFANDSGGVYQGKMNRLEQSLKGNFDGDFLAFTSYEEIDSEPHSVIPYKFKTQSIKKAIDLGYNLILWMDSPLFAVKSLDPVFEHLRIHGYLLVENIGHNLGFWASDKLLAAYDISREESFHIKQTMACFQGFRTNMWPAELPLWPPISEYIEGANEFFPGKWTNDDLSVSQDLRVRGSRHDQALISCIAHRYGLDILRGQDTFFAYSSHAEVMPIADSVCVYSQ